MCGCGSGGSEMPSVSHFEVVGAHQCHQCHPCWWCWAACSCSCACCCYGWRKSEYLNNERTRWYASRGDGKTLLRAFNSAPNRAERWRNAFGTNPKVAENGRDDDEGRSQRIEVIRGSKESPLRALQVALKIEGNTLMGLKILVPHHTHLP